MNTCVKINKFEVVDFSVHNNSLNKLINFVNDDLIPFIKDFNTSICGPFARIIYQLSRQFGYK